MTDEEKLTKDIKHISYPTSSNKLFQSIINNKKEFDYRYDSTKKKCNSGTFSLAPHQEFVKRFISYNSYYNGLLLYHGLGSGKTCSAIGITEETRKYIKYNNNFKPIMIIASQNVQENFKLQLFDKNKLKKVNKTWIIEGCLGSSLLDEIGLSQMNDLDKTVIIKKINNIIKKYYVFMGYVEFANKIEKYESRKDRLKNEFQDRLIVIDEIHNIRTVAESTDEKEGQNIQKVAKYLELLVKHVKNMKLIFLTGTPMFNGHEEIIFMLNILNMNDKKSKVKKNKIFEKDGTFKPEGEHALFDLANGYISYVRGENPYTFPQIITPIIFNKTNSLQSSPYPTDQFNGKPITEPIQYMDLYKSEFSINSKQQKCYLSEIYKIQDKYKDKFIEINNINYNMLLKPLQSLNIIFPIDEPKKGTKHISKRDNGDLSDESDEDSVDDSVDETDDDKYMLGADGLNHIMNHEYSGSPKVFHSFTYKTDNHIFKYDFIENYSIKIKSILDNVKDATGIILIYSQWISSGLIPMALALEEMGYKRYGSKGKNLINNKKNKYSYSIICGQKEYSPDINEDIEGLTNNNKDGERVKIVLVSQTGTEGIDLKNIRQVHVMEPWYNMNRIEQVIGRARRSCSHKDLDPSKGNIQVFLHCSGLSMDQIEPLDMYLYRLNEKKNIIIGNVSKLLKESSIDCLLNTSQQDFSKITDTINLELSNGMMLKDYPLKDKPYTNICDYQETCEFICKNHSIKREIDISTYNYGHAINNHIMYDLKQYFKERHIYKINEIKERILKKNHLVKEAEFQYGIERLMNESVFDKYGEKGRIIKISDLLLFQPDESNYEYMSTEERINPISRKDYFEVKEISVSPEDEYTITDFMEECNSMNTTILNSDLAEELTELIYEEKLLEIIIEMTFEYLTMDKQLIILTEIYKENDDRLFIIIRRVIKDTFIIKQKALLNDTKHPDNKLGKLHIYKFNNNVWKDQLSDITQQDLIPFIRKPKEDASYIGYIGETSQDLQIKRTIFKIKPSTKDNALDILRTHEGISNIFGHISSYRTYSNKDLLSISLQIYLRYLDHVEDTRHFLYKHEPLVNKK